MIIKHKFIFLQNKETGEIVRKHFFLQKQIINIKKEKIGNIYHTFYLENNDSIEDPIKEEKYLNFMEKNFFHRNTFLLNDSDIENYFENITVEIHNDIHKTLVYYNLNNYDLTNLDNIKKIITNGAYLLGKVETWSQKETYFYLLLKNLYDKNTDICIDFKEFFEI